ncbi:MAG: DUF3127 domain-containing protein [Bacteroidales bacterium]
MEVSGKLIELLQPKSGQSARGEWKKQDFIIETEDSFPKKVCISNWNDKVDLATFSVGSRVNVHINLESREYNGNWYTDVKVWKMESLDNAPAKADSSLPGTDSVPPWDLEPENGDNSQDLPF